MNKKRNSFSEVEHWLNFLKKWEIETNDPVPEQAIISLEVAFDKLLYDCRHGQNSQHKQSKINKKFNSVMH